MNHADNLTKKQVRNILLSFSHKDAYIRHKSRVVKPFLYANNLYEMEEDTTEFYLMGGIEEAIDFLMGA